MKYLIIAFVLISTLSLKAQDNFFLASGEVTWEKVYESEKTKEVIIAHFEKSGLFKPFLVEDGKVIATLKPQPIDVDRTGIAGVPTILRKTDFSGTIMIRFKDGKYRVTYTKIMLVGHGDLIKKGERQSFENHYVNKDGKDYRKYFVKKPRTIYNNHFTELFELKKEKKDDW
jgi:hypothetical protein